MAVSELVVGISLGTPPGCDFGAIRRNGGNAQLALAPRSIYRLEGEARWAWQHRILPTPGLRYPSRFELRDPRRRS